MEQQERTVWVDQGWPKDVTSEMLFYFLKVNGGSIVSSNSLSTYEINQARASNRMFVDDDGFGFIWLPSFKDRMPTTPDEVEMFEVCYPLPVDLPDDLKTFNADKMYKTANSQSSITQVSLPAEKVVALINSIHIDPANFEYITKNGKINGTLFTEIVRVIEEAVADATM